MLWMGVQALPPELWLQGTDEGALDYALNRALDAWYNDIKWTRALQERVMRQVCQFVFPLGSA